MTPRSPLSRLRLPVLGLALAAGCAQPTVAPAAPAVEAETEVESEHQAPAPAARATLDPAATDRMLLPALERLDDALALCARPDQREQAGPTAYEALELLAEARAAGAAGPRMEAAQAAAEALLSWHEICATFPPPSCATEPLLHLLALTGGQVPQTHVVRARILLESAGAAQAEADLRAARGETGTEEIAAALELAAEHRAELAHELQPALARFPAHAGLHDLVREAWSELPEPEAFVVAVQAAARRHPEARAEADATAGVLLLAAGLQAEATDPTRAARLHEQGGEALERARRDPDQRLSDWTLAQWRADCLANAGRLHLQRAHELLATMGLPAARPELLAAERTYGDALESVPGDEESRAGLAEAADTYYQAGDLEGVRDAFGRLAVRFDDAEWWNNHAFFCRESGLYEESFAAYEKCLELEPWNARYVNDTALILLYHLDRDLGRAEAMFRKAIELGRRACDNPFIDEASHEENFVAYTDAMLNLALLLARDGRLDEAATLTDDLLAVAPDRPDAQSLRERIEAARRGEPFPAGS